MPAFIDLTGKKFGLLTVIKRAENGASNRVQWSCKCHCGKTTIVTTAGLRSGDTKSCGCLKHDGSKKIHDISGQKFGKLTAIRPNGRSKNNKTLWLCRCDCGNEKSILTNSLVSGMTKSCGCIRIKAKPKKEKKLPPDLTDKKFGQLEVLSKIEKPKNIKGRGQYWLCRCDCGNETITSTNSLRTGHTKSCGCLIRDKSHLLIDLTGQRFGRLTVVKRGKNKSYRAVTWLCICDCGNETIVASIALRTGRTTSCGCYSREVNLKMKTKHGHAKRGNISPEFYTWTGMISRCTNPNEPEFKNYGERGINVCDRWLNSFENFLEDMGERPSKKHSIDRVDNDGDYEPDNCRWATIKEQSNNTRRNIYITIDGVTKTLTQWCRFYGVNPVTANWRIKNGWPSEKAVKEPGNRNRPKNEY